MEDRPLGRTGAPVSFGIMTAPQQVEYHDVLRVWREADTIPASEHAWLFDHLLPIGGDPRGPICEGWTLLSALAAQTERPRVGLLVTSNRFRPPAMLAKIAATVDVVSGGRLDFGIGSGSRTGHPLAWCEYEAHGSAWPSTTSSAPSGASPKRALSSVDCGPRLNRSTSMAPISTSPERSATPSRSSALILRSLSAAARHRCCALSPRTPTCGTSRAATSTTSSAAAHCWTGTALRSVAIPPRSPARSTCPFSTNSRDVTRGAIGQAIDAGFRHVVLGLPAPYPANVAGWVNDELIAAPAT